MATGEPTLRQLKHLLALSRHGHFGRAATASSIGQSAFSTSIAELERLLGQQLVERVPGDVRLTALGQRVAEGAARVVDEIEGLKGMAEAAGEPLAGQVRLGIIPTIAPFLLPRLLGELRHAYPCLRLLIRELLTPEAVPALREGVLDLALVALPSELPLLETMPLAVDPLLAVRPERGGDDFLVLADGHCLQGHGLAACGVQRDGARVVGQSLHTLIELVEAGGGWTIVPRLAVEAGLIEGRLVTIENTGAARELALAYLPGQARQRDAAALAAVVRKVLARPAISEGRSFEAAPPSG